MIILFITKNRANHTIVFNLDSTDAVTHDNQGSMAYNAHYIKIGFYRLIVSDR